MLGCQNSRNHHSWPPYIHQIYTSSKENLVENYPHPQPTQPQETKNYTYRCSVISNFKCNLTSPNCITGGHMKYKIENNKTSYPLISVSNSILILVNFMNLATDIGSRFMKLTKILLLTDINACTIAYDIMY